MIRDKKEMLNFEEVDKIETFFGLNKGMILGRGINRIIMEFKFLRLNRTNHHIPRINRIIMEFKCKKRRNRKIFKRGINRIIMEFKYNYHRSRCLLRI